MARLSWKQGWGFICKCSNEQWTLRILQYDIATMLLLLYPINAWN